MHVHTRERDSHPGSDGVKINKLLLSLLANVVHIFVDEIVRKLSATVQQVGVHDIRLAEMDVRFQCLETANYDGVLIWKVTDYARRRREAFNDTVSPI